MIVDVECNFRWSIKLNCSVLVLEQRRISRTSDRKNTGAATLQHQTPINETAFPRSVGGPLTEYARAISDGSLTPKGPH